MPERIFIGVAWPYANGPLHVGHIAGAYLPADIFARYHRIKGNDVLMVSGSDCHGTPITLRAEQEGIAPEAVVRANHKSFLNTFRTLGISFDWFTQTHSTNHHEVASSFFHALLNKGYLRRATVKAPFSDTLNRFLPDRYVEGTCSHCGFDRARGDQCDRCGTVHEPEDLIDPRSTLDAASITFRQTEHFLLELSRLEPEIRSWFQDSDHSHWRSNCQALTRNWLARGLKSRAITRDIEWGVPVPVDDANFEHKRLYVWFEAVTGYLSASIEWAKARSEPDKWRSWWEKEDSTLRSYYFIGKDNIPFHTIIWPALLISHGGLQLPYDVPANEFLNLEGRKMSTSQGWALALPDIEDRYQPDQIRYYLIANAPETRDANWSWVDFVRRNNDELVAVWGNLANRALGLAWQTYGQIPEPGPSETADRELLEASRKAFEQVGSLIEAVHIRRGLNEALALAHKANLYLTLEEPWKLVKTRPDRAATVVHTSFQIVSDLSTLLWPFLPDSSTQVQIALGYPVTFSRPDVKTVEDRFGKRPVLTGNYTCDAVWKSRPIPCGHALVKPEPLFTKLDNDAVDQELEILQQKPID